MKYKIPVEWAMAGFVEVSADLLGDNPTVDAAIEYAETHIEEFILPTDGDYISENFVILADDREFIEIIE